MLCSTTLSSRQFQLPPNKTISSPSHLQQLHAHFIKHNTPLSRLPLPDIALLCASSPPPLFRYACLLIDRASNKPPIFTWNACLQSLADSNTPVDALHLFSRLLEVGVVPDAYSCACFFKVCARLPAVEAGRVGHGLVEKLGLQSNVYLGNTIVQMYAIGAEMESARLVFDKMPQRDVVSWNMVLTHLCRKGDVGGARELFDAMPERNVRSWTTMIGGYVKGGMPKEAIQLFSEMEEKGLEPNEVTVVAVLAACADLGALDLGKRVHAYSNSCGFKHNIWICNTLIDMYIKCGCLGIAKSVFDEMEEKTVVSWSAMIAGFAIHGHGEEALNLFSKMARAGVRPNGVTFLGVLQACSHMGLLEDGRRFFTSMTKDYGISPEIEHYGCMVDLLSRAGLLEEAYDFIRFMPITPNSVVWGALLGGARLHKNVEIGEEAIKHLHKLDPSNDGYYIVLSNIYAEKKRWEDVARVRRLMKDVGVKKTPGWSTISVDGVIHEFVAGDSDHPFADQIYRRFTELLKQMRLCGYMPDTSVVLLDMDEERKEEVLFQHSEKLAVTFGLLTTPPGIPIRIMKNLRVCCDCHAALKLISRIEGRKIVVRDRNRFHCFEDGACSCKDYW